MKQNARDKLKQMSRTRRKRRTDITELIKSAPVPRHFRWSATSVKQHLTEAVSELGVVERVKKWINGRIKVAEPEYEEFHVCASVDDAERAKHEQDEVGGPADDEGHEDTGQSDRSLLLAGDVHGLLSKSRLRSSTKHCL